MTDSADSLVSVLPKGLPKGVSQHIPAGCVGLVRSVGCLGCILSLKAGHVSESDQTLRFPQVASASGLSDLQPSHFYQHRSVLTCNPHIHINIHIHIPTTSNNGTEAVKVVDFCNSPRPWALVQAARMMGFPSTSKM